MLNDYIKQTETAGLTRPDDLPDSVIDILPHDQIQLLGYWLFAQLRNQREYTERKMRPIEKDCCSHMTLTDFIGNKLWVEFRRYIQRMKENMEVEV